MAKKTTQRTKAELMSTILEAAKELQQVISPEESILISLVTNTNESTDTLNHAIIIEGSAVDLAVNFKETFNSIKTLDSLMLKAALSSLISRELDILKTYGLAPSKEVIKTHMVVFINTIIKDFIDAILNDDELFNGDTEIRPKLVADAETDDDTEVQADIESAYDINTNFLFDSVRAWAITRKLYEQGDPKTQFIKLMEETGELSKALLSNDKPEISDAIGDSIIVLTNLAELCGLKIEKCFAEAFECLKNRKGTIINNTFVKE